MAAVATKYIEKKQTKLKKIDKILLKDLGEKSTQRINYILRTKGKTFYYILYYIIIISYYYYIMLL